MALTELLENLSIELQDKLAGMDGNVQREQRFPDNAQKIKVAIGIRRSGKTFLCLQTIKEYLNSGVPLSRILYINFEDDRLLPLTQEKLVNLLESFYTLYPENHQQLCYLFLDEIQNVTDWAIVIRRFFDSRKVNIYLTGSSSKLLSKEIATSLRGRSLTLEVWPFSFQEKLASKNITIPSHLATKKSMDFMRAELLNYFFSGGFPEVIDVPFDQRIQILQNYVDVVIFRDIIERYGVTNVTLIKYLIRTLITQISTRFSVNKFYNDLKSQGIAVSKNTLHDYLTYIEDAFLAFGVSLYSESLRKIQTSPRKNYIVDSGLYYAYSSSFSKNHGRIFENFIYLILRRLSYEIFYYITKNGNEVDFLVKNLYGEMKLYQVVWDVDDAETLQREQRALNEAKQELGIPGEIVTLKSYLTKLGL